VIQAIVQGMMILIIGKLMVIMAYGMDRDGVFHKLISTAMYLAMIVVCKPLLKILFNFLLKYPIEKRW